MPPILSPPTPAEPPADRPSPGTPNVASQVWLTLTPTCTLGGEICLILPPSERTCRRLSQEVASRETLRNRKVIKTKSTDDNQNREPHKNRQQRP
jgi:hypothetical protein